MKEYYAPRLVAVSEALTQCKVLGISDEGEKPEGRQEIAEWLQSTDPELRYLGLEMTRVYANRIKGQIAQLVREKRLLNDLLILDQRFRDELEGIHFFHISPDKLSFCSKTDLFGEQFKIGFPTANSEVIEAGNCFAFDRHTACVFHLMRGLEVVLKALFHALGLPPLTKAGERNWNGILRQIKDKLEADKNITDFDFYDAAYAFLAAAKNPIRNATMHIDATYDEEGARMVFDALGAFMRHIATKLKQQP
jgi:hypothetical protein